MAKRKEKRVKWLHLRISQKEYDLLQDWAKRSTCRKSSEFIRNALFQRPIRVFYRSKSADEFLSAALKLKNELSSIGNNFNQVVRKLYLLRTEIGLKEWVATMELEKEIVLKKTVEIGTALQAIYDLLKEEALTRKLHLDGPILSSSTRAAAADEQENKAQL